MGKDRCSIVVVILCIISSLLLLYATGLGESILDLGKEGIKEIQKIQRVHQELERWVKYSVVRHP